MSLYDPICGRRITEFDYVGNATDGVVMVVPKKDNYWFAYSAWTSTSLAPKDLPESVQRKFVEQFQSRCAESLLAPSILKQDYEPVRVITPAGLFEERVLAFRKSSAARLVESDISEAAKVPEGSIVAKNKSDQIVQITPKIGRFTAYSAMPVDASAAKKKDIKLGHIYSRDEYAEGKLFADPVIDDFDIAIFLKKLDKVMDDLNLPPADWALVYSVAGGSVKGASGWMYHSPGSGPVSPVYLNRAPSSTATAKYAEWKSPRSPHTMVHEYAHVVWFGQMTSQQRAEVTAFYNLRVAKDPAKALADKTSPTEYGTTKVEEWWAEIVGYAMYGADKRISKEVYDFISDVLTGKVAPAAEKPSSKKQKAVIDTPAPKGEEPKKPAAADSSALAAINAKKDKIEAAIGKYKVEQRADGSVRVIPEKSPNDKKVLLDLLIAAGFYYDSAKHKARLSTGSSGGIVVFESHVHEAHLLEQIADQDSHVEPLEETPATRIDLYPNEEPARRISAVAQVGVSDIGRARQKYRFDCGPAALRVVAEHYGIPASQDELIDLCGSTEDAGTPPDDLVFAARALGLQAETVKGMSTEALLDSLSQGVPVICPIQAWAASAKGVKDLEEGHYVVAIGFDGTNLIFEDPSMDQQGYIPLDEFETRWIDKQYGDPKPLRRLGIPVRYSRTTDESLDESSIPSLQKKLKELEQIGADADVTYTRSKTKRTGLFARGSTVLDQFTIKNTGKSAPATKPEAIEYWRAQLDLQLTPLRSQKEALQQLQDLARTHATLINQLHKQKKLEFVSIPVSEYNALGRHNSILLYKSPSHNQRQSSEYRLAMRDGRLVYIRKSNHWGRFSTNIRVGDPDSPPNSEPDQFGRTGARFYEWSLLGGDEGSARSQAGYVFVLPDANESLDEASLSRLTVRRVPSLSGSHPEARYDGRFGVLVTPKFFKLDSAAQRHVLFHELGHWFRDEHIPLMDVMGFEPGENFFIYNQPNSEEGFAEAFASFFTDPQHFRVNWPEQYRRMQEYIGARAAELRAWVAQATATLSESLDEEQLDETVQQVRKYLTGDYQVLDHGNIGLFRVYSVVDYPAENKIMIPVRNLHRIHGHKWVNFLSQVHTVADYNKNRDGPEDQVVYLTDLPAHPPTLATVRKNIEDASGAITGLGIPRQRDTLILLDLSKKTNQITGGGVGGYAYRRTHAIEVDAAYMAEAGGVYLLVHEWGHKKFFNLPQFVTKFVREWFETNVVQHAESKYAPLISPRDQENIVIAAWDAFNEAWKKWEGIYPEQYAQFKKRAKETKFGDESALLDVFLAPSMSAVGKLTKGVKNEREGTSDTKSLRTGTRVLAVSARAVIPDGYALVPLKGDTPSGKDAIYTSRETLLASFELDAEASAKKNDTNLGTISYRLHSLQIPDEPGEEHTDNYFTRASSLSAHLDDAVHAAAARLQKKYPNAPTLSFMLPNVRSILVDEWIAQVRREGDRFDPKAAFFRLFKSNADWSLGLTIDPAERLTSPYGDAVRDTIAKLGITPSSYAASNVDELWAELIAMAALNPSKVPKPLKALLRDAIQGKTPGPGQRMKQDNTPAKFRKAASESFALLDANPFLDEMDKHGTNAHAAWFEGWDDSTKADAT